MTTIVQDLFCENTNLRWAYTASLCSVLVFKEAITLEVFIIYIYIHIFVLPGLSLSLSLYIYIHT